MRTVIALGGNAIASDDDVTIPRQKARIGELADAVGRLTERGHELLFTHGNGPQIGQLLLQQSAADAPERPLDVLVAETQAQIGYLIADQLESGVDGRVTTVVTRVCVDPSDQAFEDPTKPIGPYYTEAEAAEKPFETGPVDGTDGNYCVGGFFCGDCSNPGSHFVTVQQVGLVEHGDQPTPGLVQFPERDPEFLPNAFDRVTRVDNYQSNVAVRDSSERCTE